MKQILFYIIICVNVLSGCGSSFHATAPKNEPHLLGGESNRVVPEREPRLVADQLYYSREGGNKAYEITGKFQTREKMTETLRLDTVLGELRRKEWVLADVIVSMDFNANGHVASWCVSGPARLIENYVELLRQSYVNKKVLYGFSVRPIDVKPSAYWERDE